MRSVSIGAILLSLSLVACESPDQGGKTAKAVSSKDVREKAAAAVQAITDFAGQKNNEYRRQIEAQLEELDQKIRKLNAKMAELGAEASQDLKDVVDQMSEQTAEARQKLADLGTTTGENIEALKENISKQVGDLKESYDKASSSAE